MLDADEMACVAPQADRAVRKGQLASLTFFALCTYPFAHVLFWLNTRVFDVAPNAVFDGRRMEWWLVPGMVIAGALSLLFVPMFARAAASVERDRLDRYLATQDGVDPTRSSVVWCLLLASLTIPVGWMAWSNGILIDERGVSVRLGWYHDVRAYVDVSSVDRCVAAEAVRIHFRTGKPVTIRDGRTRVSPEDADRIATYVAQRAGCQITRPAPPCGADSTRRDTSADPP